MSLSDRLAGNTLTLPRTTLGSLIMDAYDVRDYQFSGLPSWATCKDHYEIRAKVAPEETLAEDRLRLMLQTLLSDRFQLRIHRETRSFRVYELTTAKRGGKLKLVSAPTPDSHTPWRTVPLMIEGFLDLPVVDKTGLTGFVPRGSQEWDATELIEELKHGGRPAPSIFHEVEVQFGLSLRQASQTTGFLVIDHVERPSAN